MSKIRGGDAFGIGDASIDVTRAILLDAVSVAVVGTANPAGAGRALALNLEGRLNKGTTRVDVLYLMDSDGAATIISELLGLAGRVGPDFLAELMARIEAMPRQPGPGTPGP
ncbi:hypothetical protein [Cellulomonas sp. URHB0016]